MTRKPRQIYESVYKHFPLRCTVDDLMKYVDYLHPRQDFCIAILPEGLTMAKNNAFTKIEFCNIRLSDTAKKDFKKWVASDEFDLGVLLEHMVDAGYKISLSSDNSRATYIVSMTCKDTGSPNNDYCVVSRAPTLDRAISITLYKFFVLLRDVTWSDFVIEDDWG